jgi:antitoxin (DNA-binding transcriptional repressor) of toxin-antitoxin stability system
VAYERRAAVTASELRQNIYRLLDEVLETGEPLEIERKGRRLRVVPDPRDPEPGLSKLDRIKGNRDLIIGDPEDLIHIDWSVYWDPDQNTDPR